MKNRPVYEYQDGRGHSVRFAQQKNKRARARKLAEKLMGKNYFMALFFGLYMVWISLIILKL